MSYKTYEHLYKIYKVRLPEEWIQVGNPLELHFKNPSGWQFAVSALPKDAALDFLSYIASNIKLFSQDYSYWSNVKQIAGEYFNYTGIQLRFTDRSVPGTVRKAVKYILDLPNYYVNVNFYFQVDTPLEEVEAFLRELPELLIIRDVPIIDELGIRGIEDDDIPWKLKDALKNPLETEELYLRDSSLSEVPRALGSFRNLRVLDLSDTEIKVLPDFLLELERLETLDLHECKLTVLPDWIAGFKKLKKLEISHNPIKALPDSLAKLEKLETLEANGCELQILPHWIGKLSKLKSLSFAHTQIQEVPETLVQLEKLSYLDLGSNKLFEIPAAVYKLPELKELIANNANIDFVPAQLLSHPKLLKLWLEMNNIESLPDNFSASKLQFLQLSHNNIKVLPSAFSGFSDLKALLLRHNPISNLMEHLPKLKNLEILSLTGCALSELDPDISELKSLQFLDLADNHLTSLPDSIGQLRSLERLDLSNNQFTSLPKSLASLPQTTIILPRKEKVLYMDISYKAPKPENPITDTAIYARYDEKMTKTINRLFHKSEYSGLIDALQNIALKGLAIRTTHPCPSGKIGLSKFGGQPDLPTEFTYPRTDGELWLFLAQLNLADFAPFNAILPRSGYLWFFLEELYQIEPKVIYRDVPASALKPFDSTNNETFVDDSWDEFYHPFCLDINTYPSLPCFYNEDFVYDLDKTGKLAEIEFIEIDELYSFNPFGKLDKFECIHSINTYPFTQHESPQLCAAEEKGGREQDWLLLLALESDTKVGFQFGDSGSLYFMIHKDDLANRDFNNIFIHLESS